MTFDYHWWDLEKSNFKGVLYDTIGCFYLYDHPYENWEEFEADLPHMAYTHLVGNRFHSLERLFVDLRVITQMLGVLEIPVRSEKMDIDRYDWLKSILDLKLYRFASIRDVSFHFVNELLCLEIEDRKLNLNNLKKAINDSHPIIIQHLVEISGIGLEIRDERNIRAHVGYADLGTDDDETFKFFSHGEASGGKILDYDIETAYKKASAKMYLRLVEDTNSLLSAVISLVDELVPDFESIYQQKRMTNN